MNKRMLSLCVVLIAIALMFSAAIAADESGYLKIAYSQETFSTIDQALVMDSSQLVDEMAVGVLVQSEITGDLMNGMAISQSASEDGRTYTFDLRTDVPWVRYNAETDAVEEVLDCDGKVRYVTAYDFLYGVERSLRPQTASDYAFILHFLEGGEAYNTSDPGTVDFDTVGVKALDADTISYTFRDAGVFNINVLSMWVSYAMPSWLIEGDACNEALPDTWTETGNYQGYGPFVLKEWLHDDHLTIIANPFWPGIEAAPKASIPGVHIKFMDTSSVLAEYEADNMDVSLVPATDIDRIQAHPVLSKELQTQPGSIGTEFVILNPTVEHTSDIRIRKALSLSLDRLAVIQTKKTGIEAPIFIHPALSGAPKIEDFPNLGVKLDNAAAKALIDDYCAEKGIKPADIHLSFIYPTREDLKPQVEVVQYMWETTLGIKIELKNVEWAVFKDERKESRENIYRASWSNDYKDANNFTADMFNCGSTIQKIADWPSKDCVDISDPAYQDYSSTVIAAGLEQDIKKREALYAHAEEILVNDVALIIPILYFTDHILYKPYISAPISWMGNDRWEKWSINR